jgi:pimeloyl-ACP methyl ester carboxylesterase
MAFIESVEGRYVYLTIQGVEYRVYYEEAGKGMPIICQHSAGSVGLEWRHMLTDPEIISKYHVIVADLPYHGRSLPPESVQWWKQEYKLTKSFFMDFQVELARALGLERPVYMGTATGGFLALNLALSHADDFRAVIGVECALSAGTATLDTFYHPNIGNDYKRANSLYFSAPTSPEKYRRAITWVAMLTAPPVTKGDMNYYFIEHDMVGKCDRIDTSKCAVYLFTGEYDPTSSVEDTRELAKLIKGAHFFELNGMSHSGMAENPEAFKKYLMPVLAEIEKTTKK